MDLKEILNAWLASFNPTSIQRQMSQKRIAVCNECPSLVKKLNINRDWAAYCGECGCPINKKIFSTTNNPCPLSKWAEVDGDMYLPKKEKTLI